MGKTVQRAALGVATMGLSETVRAVQGVAQGGDPISGLTSAATFGAVDKNPLTKSPTMPDMSSSAPGTNAGQFPDTVKAAAAAAASQDDEDPLNRVRRRASTLLTGGLGVSDAAPVQRKTLLGN